MCVDSYKTEDKADLALADRRKYRKWGIASERAGDDIDTLAVVRSHLCVTATNLSESRRLDEL